MEKYENGKTTLCVYFGKQAKRDFIHRSEFIFIETGMGHKNNIVEGFSKKYGVHTLVWYEMHETMESAILREKAIKNWKRAWKIKMIEEMNPQWRDLYPELL